MGCVPSSDSESFQPSHFDHKAVLWLLGGGPGSPKQQLAEHLADKYKFKYLSAMDLIRYQESANSPESAEIRKALEEKAEISSSLILRVLQKVMVLYGPRKYLIDNFPRSMADVGELESLCGRHPQVRLEGYLQLELEESQMKESGVKALGETKKQATAEQIEREVRAIIENYRAKSKPILQFYQSKGLAMKATFPNNDPQLTISQVDLLLAEKKLRPVQRVPLFCLNGNEQAEVYSFGLRLARLFAFKFWSIRELKEEFGNRPEVAKYLAETKEEDIEGAFLVDLIQRKLERYNYKGRYLITGFPRNQKDVGSLRAKLNREVALSACITCLHTPATQKERETFQSLHSFLSLEEEIQTALIHSTESSFAEIEGHMRRVVPKMPSRTAKIVLCPTFEGEGGEHFKKMEQWCDVTDFQQIVSGEIRKQKFASSLLSSCLALKKAVPSYIAGNLFAEMVGGREQEGARLLVLKGFPQDIQQLKVVLSRSDLAGVLCGMFVQSSRIRKNIKSPPEAALTTYEQICSSLEASCDKVFKINEKTTYQQVRTCLSAL